MLSLKGHSLPVLCLVSFLGFLWFLHRKPGMMMLEYPLEVAVFAENRQQICCFSLLPCFTGLYACLLPFCHCSHSFFFSFQCSSTELVLEQKTPFQIHSRVAMRNLPTLILFPVSVKWQRKLYAIRVERTTHIEYFDFPLNFQKFSLQSFYMCEFFLDWF